MDKVRIDITLELNIAEYARGMGIDTSAVRDDIKNEVIENIVYYIETVAGTKARVVRE